MKKINKNGFVLAEAIIVAVFVLGMFTFLIVNVLPLISKYNNIMNYDNPEEIYAINLFIEALNIEANEELDLDKFAIDIIKRDEFSAINPNNFLFRKVENFPTPASGKSETCSSKLCMELKKEDYINIKSILYIKKDDITSDINIPISIGRGFSTYYNYFKNQHNDEIGVWVLISFKNGKYAGVVLK